VLTDTSEALLAGLNAAQREAVLATRGPVAILAGAGTGKTRVISRRAAVAIATDVVPADQVLIVTFTDRAAGEMGARLASLGLPGVTARTFHAQALAQLRHFWPSRNDGRELPEILDSKLPILVPLARSLPGHYRFTPVKDLADEIEWAKSRRIAPTAYMSAAGALNRSAPIPDDLFVRLYADYERAKDRSNRLDFDDLLLHAVELLEADTEACMVVRARKRWFSVDEYQDTNPLQERLLELWLGDRDDVCVVGDEDQTIYTFTGATPRFLTGFAERHPGSRVIALTENYRSSPQVLELANRLIAETGRSKALTAIQPDGPAPRITGFPDAAGELAALTAGIARLIEGGTPAAEIAVLVRMNAQIAALAEALTAANIPHQVRGIRFYDRRDVRGAIDLVARARLPETGQALETAIRRLLRETLGYEEGAVPAGEEARERAAALDVLLGILGGLVADAADVDASTFVGELRRRARRERTDAAGGVNLLTYHRAKGLEWDAVFLPMLEDGILPIRHALDDHDGLAEERRLLYVGITRARCHLVLSWASRRESRGREGSRQRSRFLDGLVPRPERRVVQLPDAFRPAAGRGEDPYFAALRDWRSARARADAVPAYVVAPNATLEAIAEVRPTTMAGLRRVKGMGPSRLERYGSEVLDVIAATAGHRERGGGAPPGAG
jgi:DNA helicase II / ATP-dependent DNA helicase PcrA